MGKRKYFDDHSRSDARGLSIGDTYGEVKRARTSESERPHVIMDSSRFQQQNDDDGWQVVSSKRHRSKTHRDANYRGEDTAAKPKVYFDPRQDVRQPVRLEDLRDLALYILTDSTAPSWVAVKRRKDIRKVVVVMVCGMDELMLARSKHLSSTAGNKLTDSNVSKALQDGNSEASSIQWLMEQKFLVRAPGDSRQPKIHSPLQAMIMKGSDEIGNVNKGMPTNERAFQPVRTPISDFVHTAEELREAEYPIHTALFASHADQTLEIERRKGAQQNSDNGWVDSDVDTHQLKAPPTSDDTRQDFVSQGLNIYAVDCEMVLTSDEKSSLARVSVVSWPDGRIVLDKYVKPELAIVNYFTQYSGITEKILENVTTRLSDIQAELKKLLSSSTVLLGHSLESDLNALKMTHPFIIDTSMIYPHPRGLPLRSSLKFLANKYLKREIQKGGADGHDSVEDARAVLDLVKLKCEKGPKWGTTEANGETVFKKISRTTRDDGRARTHAIVEYGTPERGFGKDATVAIGCQNDNDIVEGVIRCSNGHRIEDGNGEIPDGGVDFVWARLRALEFARGWNVNSSNTSQTATAAAKGNPVSDTNGAKDSSHSIEDQTTPSAQGQNPNPPPQPHPPTPEQDKILTLTLQNINKIRHSLPKNTLLILCSGTSDMRLVTHYQSLQSQYRREFKTKKWNELSVKWTDVEEQGLRRAVEEARLGWGWVGVV